MEGRGTRFYIYPLSREKSPGALQTLGVLRPSRPRSINFLNGLVGIDRITSGPKFMPSYERDYYAVFFQDLRISDLNLSTSPRLIVHPAYRNVLASRPDFSSSGRAEARCSNMTFRAHGRAKIPNILATLLGHTDRCTCSPTDRIFRELGLFERFAVNVKPRSIRV